MRVALKPHDGMLLNPLILQWLTALQCWFSLQSASSIQVQLANDNTYLDMLVRWLDLRLSNKHPHVLVRTKPRQGGAPACLHDK